MDYVPEKLDFATVQKYIPGMTKKAEDVLQNTLPAMPETFGISELNKAHATFMEQRKLAKKELAVRTAKVDSFKIPEPKRALSAIETELADVLRKDGAQKGERTAASLYENAVANKKKAEEALVILQDKIDANTSTKPVPSVLEDIMNGKKEANKNIVNAKAMINTINDNIIAFTNTYENLGKPVCPISERLICTTDKTAAKDEIADLIAANKEGLAIQQEIVNENTAKIAELEKREAEYRANETMYREKTMLIARYEDQKKSVPMLPPKPAAVTIVDYTWQIKELQIERNNALAWEQHKKDIAEQEMYQLP
jgi:hypothetical protein